MNNSYNQSGYQMMPAQRMQQNCNVPNGSLNQCTSMNASSMKCGPMHHHLDGGNGMPPMHGNAIGQSHQEALNTMPLKGGNNLINNNQSNYGAVVPNSRMRMSNVAGAYSSSSSTQSSSLSAGSVTATANQSHTVAHYSTPTPKRSSATVAAGNASSANTLSHQQQYAMNNANNTYHNNSYAMQQQNQPHFNNSQVSELFIIEKRNV